MSTRITEERKYGEKEICNAECPVHKSGDPLVKEKDPYYSNQTQVGTCVRHAIAKAIQREISWVKWRKSRGGPIDYDWVLFTTQTLVNAMAQAVPKGSRGAWPKDYDGVNFQISGLDGHIYEIEISIHRMENHKNAHVAEMAVLDLSQAIGESYQPKSLHAVYKAHRRQYSDTGINSDMFLVYRNSWGHSQEWLTVDKSTLNGLHSSYWLNINNLVKKGQNCPDTYLIHDDEWVQ